MDNNPEEKELNKTTLITAEYNSLRGEIISRIGLRQNLLSLALIVFGALMGTSLQPNVNTSVLLVYPIISFFLSVACIHSDIRVKQLADYIRQIETNVAVIGWSLHIKNLLSEKQLDRITSPLSTIGLFISTQIIAILIAFLNRPFNLVEWILFIIDLVFIFITIVLSSRTKGWRL